MAFAAIHIPNFPVQAVIRAEPSLRVLPVALLDGTPPILNVFAVNEPARQTGIEMGMARAAAEQFDSVQIRRRSQAQEKIAHAALLDLAWSISPRVEDTAQDTLVVDLAGLSSLFGSDKNIADLLAQRIEAFGLTAQIAVVANLETAIHAARGFPGITIIALGDESKCLGLLPIGVLGPSAETLETLDLWGVRTCAALAALPILELSERLGREGVRLHEWSRGAGVRSIVLAEPSASFEEEMELEDSVEELDPLSFLLGRLLDQLCQRLTARSLAAASIYLRFELDPAGTKDVQIRTDASRRKKKSALYQKTLTLPVPMRDSKMLLNLLRLQLQGDPPTAPILKILMAAEAARPRAVQTGLFLPPSPDVAKLELAIARLANLVGESNIGSPQLVDTHRPDEFRMQRFTPSREGTKSRRRKSGAFAKASSNDRSTIDLGENPAPSARHNLAQRGSAGLAQNKIPSPVGAAQASNFDYVRISSTSTSAATSSASCYASSTSIGFRMFRPPLAANVQLNGSHPKRVFFRGVRGDVLAASGPWRTSGDWWREDAWHQDEWDLEIRFHASLDRKQKNLATCPQHGLYRFYFDSLSQSWFVRGIYD